MAFDPISLALSKNYTAETAEGMGAVQGKPGPAGPQGPEGPPGPQGPPGADGGGMSLTFSEKETIVGTYLGKPLYARVYRTNIPPASMANQNLEIHEDWFDEIEDIICFQGWIDVSTSNGWSGSFSIPCVNVDPQTKELNYADLYYNNATNHLGIRAYFSDGRYYGDPIYLTIMYLKKS